MKTVKEIVLEYLREKGFDGLFSDECGCRNQDLGPCGEMSQDCTAGYIRLVANNPEGYDFYIQKEKPLSTTNSG